MATISARTEESVFKLNKWLGLHENPDGDTKLKYGEGAAMRNWKITRDGNLQRRPGNRMIEGLLCGYKLSEGTKELQVKVDRSVSSIVRMKPNAYASFDGFAVLDGETVDVDYNNHSDYIGYYGRIGLATYKLSRCVFSEAEETFTWYAFLVTVVPNTDEPEMQVAGLWTGDVNGKEEFLAACNGRLWRLWDDDTQKIIKVDLGPIDTSGRVSFFPFSNVVYMLNGVEYYVYDGISFGPVTGYRPLISVSNVPAGGGTLLEGVNKLNGLRRIWFSPDGTSKEFQLPETDLMSIDYVFNNGTGEYVDPSDYSYDLIAGKVTFDTAPDAITNNIEIGYSAAATFRPEVTSMTNFELYSGTQEARVFIYGNGTNEALYSEIDYDGKPRADYFPDLNEMTVGDSNTPITGMVRHYSKLIVFKTHSAWSVQYSLAEDAEGAALAAFYVTPVNKTIGNCALGQVQLVLNSPYTLHGNDVYEWHNSSSYSSNLSIDERQAKRISDRIYASLRQFDLPKCYCYDDNESQEYYICNPDGTALIHNYAADAWYKYTSFKVTAMCVFHGELYYGTPDGRLEKLSTDYNSNDGEAIDAYWESGSMDFGRNYQRKFSAALWVGIKPESRGCVYVTVVTDRKAAFADKQITSNLFSFNSLDFEGVDFDTNRQPRVNREKLKAKKFVYYKLILKNSDLDTTATVLAADIKVRFSGYAK